MVEFGTSFIAHEGPLRDLVKYAKMAEEIGFNHVTISDDFNFRDVFSVLAILGINTNRANLSFITNPYSRNPAMIARATATLDDITNGRTSLGLCTGGSLTLKPLCIPMWNKPLTAIKETIEICRRLLRGETVDYDGELFKLKGAHLSFNHIRREIPIFVAGRGPRLLELAGTLADGVHLGVVPLPYLDFAIKQVKRGAQEAGRDFNKLRIISSLSFIATPEEEFEKFLRWRIANILLDTPNYVLENLQVESDLMKTIWNIKRCKNLQEASKFVKIDVIKLFPTANTSDSCTEKILELMKKGVKTVEINVPPGNEDAMFPIIANEIIPQFKNK